MSLAEETGESIRFGCHIEEIDVFKRYISIKFQKAKMINGLRQLVHHVS